MLFNAVLGAVLVYLAACYAYGLVLLWKLYLDRRSQTIGGTIGHGVMDIGTGERSSPTVLRPAPSAGADSSASSEAKPIYRPTAKAA